MSTLQIREATRDDANLIFHFVRELAIYEKAEHEVVTSAAELEHAIFDAGTTTQALICEHRGEAVGFAIYFLNFSTWLGKHGIHLEDLYVTPEKRGVGAGKAMLVHLAQIAVNNGYGRFEWNVLDWNEPSIKFYEALGAKAQSEWIGYRLQGTDLQAVAAMASDK